MTGLAARRVAPFGHPGITACVQLPRAYRSLPRPSSPLDAKAFTMCLIAFDLKLCAGTLAIALPRMVWIPHTGRREPEGPLLPQPSIPQLSKSEKESMCATGGVECGRLPGPFVRIPEGRDYSVLQKGGDPAAGSPTATLLRLRPSH